MMEDDKHLCRAPGIGKKTAGRIILELKDKIKKDDVVSDVNIQEGFEDIVPANNNEVGEALGALLALGYSEKEADSKGIGLKNMQERVTSLGGTLQINGKNGFRIFAVIPKQQD
mgnify:CR=1 FL=1